MKHILFLYYFLAFSAGSLAFLAAVILYLKTKSRLILQFLIFFLLLSAFVISLSFYYYLTTMANFKSAELEFAFTALFFLTTGTFVYYIPFYTSRLLNQELPNWKNIIFTVLGILPALFIFTTLLPLSAPISEKLERLTFYMYSIYVNIFYFVSIYVWIKIFRGLKNIKNLQIKKLLKTTLIISIICFPGFVADGYWSLIQYKLRLIPFKLTFTPFFYLIISLICIYEIIQYFQKQHIHEFDYVIPDNFITHYQLTEKDIKIIKMVIQGKTYTEMANELFISNGTVKNYVSVIYHKTKVNKRFELLTKINTFQTKS